MIQVLPSGTESKIIWSKILYNAEERQRKMEDFENRYSGQILNILWTESIFNEKDLFRINTHRSIMKIITKKEKNG